MRVFKSVNYWYRGYKINIDMYESYPILVEINYMGKVNSLHFDVHTEFPGKELDVALANIESNINAAIRLQNSLNELAEDIVKRRERVSKENEV